MAGPGCKGIRCGGCGKPLRECSCKPEENSAHMNNFGPYAVMESEGARVAVTDCRLCGAAIMCDPRDTEDNRAIHWKWHTARSGESEKPVDYCDVPLPNNPGHSCGNVKPCAKHGESESER